MSTNSGNNNVVPLSQARKRSAETDMKDVLSRLPEPVVRIRALSEKCFTSAIQNMFDCVDDALFELADRTQSNLEQNVFFESMREIRIHRRTMEKVFVEGINQQFASLLNATPNKQTPLGEQELGDDLSLVSKDELEELVAIDSLAMKAAAHNKNELFILAGRLNSMVPAKVVEESVPVSPKVLADSFVEASKTISVDIKAKLVLFKLFERHVMSQLSTVLDQVNNELTHLGVAIPKPSKPTHAERPQPSSTQYAAPVDHLSNEQEGGLFNTLQSLIQAPVPSKHNQRVPTDYDVQEAPYALINILSQLQQQISQVPVVTDRIDEAPQLISPNQITDAISDASGAEEELDDRSNNVIKLVDMLFSFILEDKNLPDPIKLLLSRLQIPFIKVALVDEDFFKKDGHAARRLLNEMATASIGWSGDPSSSRKDPLYDKINTIVERVLNEFDNNFEIFSLLLADFVSFIEKERRRVMLFEKRAIDAEGGKAKAQVGRQTVEKQVANLLAGKVIPSIFSQFVRGPWSNILFLAYMRHGINSSEWAEAFTVAEDLVWSALPIQNSPHKMKFLQTLPLINSALHKGLKSISFNPVKQTKIFELLKTHHLALLEDFRERSLTEESLIEVDELFDDVDSDLDATINEEMVQNPSEIPTLETIAPTPPAAIEEPAVALQMASVDNTVAPSEDVASVVNQPIVEPEKLPAQSQDESTQRLATETPTPVEPEVEASVSESSVPEAQYVNLVDNFVVGVWFERIEDDSTFRCRLAAFIRGTGRYIFVNRSGVKVAEETRESLALQLQKGQLRTLDDSMLFDRALESMITNLRTTS